MVDGAIDLVVLDIIPSVAPNTRRLWVNAVSRWPTCRPKRGCIMVPNKMTRHDVVHEELDHVCQCLVKVLHIAAKATPTAGQYRSYKRTHYDSTPSNSDNNNNNKVYGATILRMVQFSAYMPMVSTETSPNAASSNVFLRTTATVTVATLANQNSSVLCSKGSSWIESCCSKR
jgi:hypothetical protein